MILGLTDAVGAAADPIADTPERAEFRAALRQLIASVSPLERVRELDETETFDDELYAALAEMGVLSVGAPEAIGGIGDVRDQIVAIEEIAAGPTSMAAFLILQFMIIQVLGAYGSPEQQALLQGTMEGKLKISFALSEPAGGTDVARAMQTRAERTSTGYRISGQKLWITAASIADYVLVLARTAAWERSPVEGVTMLLVPTSAPGLQVRDLETFGHHGVPTCEVFFHDVEVPEDAVVGEVDRGLRHAFATLNRERLTAAAAALGVGRGALEFCVDYAKKREAFGRPLGAFMALQHRLVDGALALEAARGLTVRAAEIEAAGGHADVLSTMAKIAAAEAGSLITDNGMRLLAGMGFSREVPMQRWFRDVRLWNFAPTSDEMSRNYLGERLLGLPRSY